MVKNIVAQVDYELSLNAKSGAASDGQDTNKVTAKLSANGVLVQNKEVTLQVDGHAVFANGEQSTSGMTNLIGEVSEKLTNTRSETVTITAKSEGKTETATSIFGDGEGTDYIMTLTSKSGVQANTLTATLLNGDVPVSGETIKFRTNGSAIFSNNQQEITATTNGDGKAVVSLTDTVSETVTVTAIYEDATSTADSIFRNGEVDVYLKKDDFNLSNICWDYEFTKGQKYSVVLPEVFNGLIVHAASPHHRFNPRTQALEPGEPDREIENAINGYLADSFIMEIGGVLGYFTTAIYYKAKTFSGEGWYTFKIEIVK